MVCNAFGRERVSFAVREVDIQLTGREWGGVITAGTWCGVHVPEGWDCTRNRC